jgi:hypothetical protein
VDSEEEDE